MASNKINFSENWNNKLGNNIFSTIRLWTPEKETFYKASLNKNFEVLLNGKPIRQVKLSRIDIKKYIEIPPELLVLDTGLTSFIGIQGLFEQFGLKTIYDKMLILWFKKEGRQE